MGTQQHLHVVQLPHLIMVNGDQSHLPKAVTLHPIMHDITQTIERITLCQFLLRFLNGSRHPETEATAIVNLNL